MANRESKKKVFLSYTTQEEALAKALQLTIQNAFAEKVQVFVGENTIRAGDVWLERIAREIRDCQLFIALLSPLSLSRQWVSFECGAALVGENRPRIALCHSGQHPGELPTHMKFDQTLELCDPELVCSLFKWISKKLDVQLNETQKEDDYIESINKNVEEIVCGKRQRAAGTPAHSQASSQETFLLVKLYKNGGALGIAPSSKPPVTKRISENEWSDAVSKMTDFLHGKKKSSGDVNIAIGVQNCLYDSDSNNVYVGVRMKSTEDASQTSVRVAQGSFNTGYKLLRAGDGMRVGSASALQDLFVLKKDDALKRTVNEGSPTYQRMKEKADSAGIKLWRIGLGDDKDLIGTVFINNSHRFPRFEIGIWKYVDISDLRLPRRGEDGQRIPWNKEEPLWGFGEDLYQDYRGQADQVPCNYWIWASEGEVFYWSYPEERLIPRCKPTKGEDKPKDSALLSMDYMIETYGVRTRYTPFARRTDVSGDDVIKAQFSFPAREILTYF